MVVAVEVAVAGTVSVTVIVAVVTVEKESIINQSHLLLIWTPLSQTHRCLHETHS